MNVVLYFTAGLIFIFKCGTDLILPLLFLFGRPLLKKPMTLSLLFRLRWNLAGMYFLN